MVPVVQVFSAKVEGEMTSRLKLLVWVNETLRTDFKRVNELCTGAAYCQLFDMIFPHVVPMHRVRMYTNMEVDFVHNFKILVACFDALGVQKAVPVGRLVKGYFKDNLDFLQWFRKFYDANRKDLIYDPIDKRRGVELGFGPPKQRQYSNSKTRSDTPVRGSRLCSNERNCA